MRISLSSLEAKPVYGRDGRIGTAIADTWDEPKPILARPSDKFRIYEDAENESAFVEKKTRFGWKRVTEMEMMAEWNGLDWLRDNIIKAGATIIWGNINNCPYEW